MNRLFVLLVILGTLFSLPEMVLANVACYPSCQDCTGTDVSTCNNCDVNKMNVTAHAPNLATYIFTMTWSSNDTATCTAGTFTNETWTNNTHGYSFCPVEGQYNVTVNVSALDGSSYGNEGSWNGVRSASAAPSSTGMFTLYTVDYDTNENWCICKMGSEYWSLGGETASTSCCGDDSAEFKKNCIKAGDVIEDVCSASFDNVACCDSENKCIYKGTCYNHGILNPDYSDIKCNSGKWSYSFDEVEQSFTIHPGWNLISIPIKKITSIDNDPCNVFSRSFSYWYATTKKWEFYSWSQISGGKAYWLRSENSCTVNVKGYGSTSVNDIPPLKAGYNFVGALSSAKDINSIKGSCTLTQDPLYWDVSTQDWKKTTTIEPTKGYWIHVAGDCQFS